MPDTHINDLMVTALVKEGYTGDLNQMLAAWLGTEGTVGPHINDRWQQYFDILGIYSAEHVTDRQYIWLGNLGYTQEAVNDRLYAYWQARNLLP